MRQRAISRSKRPERDTAAAMGKKALAAGSLQGPFGDVAPEPVPPRDKDPALIGGRPGGILK